MKHSTNQHNINTTVRLGCWHCTWFSSHFKEQLYQNINLHSLFSIMSHSSSSPFHLWINLDLLRSSTTVPKPLNRFLRFPYKHLLDVIIIGLRHFGSVLFCSVQRRWQPSYAFRLGSLTQPTRTEQPPPCFCIILYFTTPHTQPVHHLFQTTSQAQCLATRIHVTIQLTCLIQYPS